MAFTSISPTRGNLGSTLTAGNIDKTTLADFPSAEVPPVYISRKLVANRAPLLAAYQGGLTIGGVSKALKSNSPMNVGDIKFRWAELDVPPMRFVVTAVVGGSDYMTLDSNYGLTPGTILKNLRTDDIITVVNVSATTTASAAGANLGSLDATGTLYWFYSGTDPVVGDELVSLGVMQEEGGGSAFSFDVQSRMRYNTMTDLQYPFEFSAHAAKLKTGGFAIPDHKRIAYQHFVSQLEACLLLGEATSATPGATASVSNIAVPDSRGKVALETQVHRRGEGLYAQVKSYGFTTSFSNTFDFDALDEICFQITRKGEYRRLTGFCGADAIRAVSRFQDARVSADDFTRGQEKLFMSNIKTIEMRNGAMLDLVEHPLLSETSTHNGTMMLFPLENLKTVHMEGLGWNGNNWQEDVQPNDMASMKSVARYTGSVALQDAHNSAALITDIG